MHIKLLILVMLPVITSADATNSLGILKNSLTGILQNGSYRTPLMFTMPCSQYSSTTSHPISAFILEHIQYI